MELKILLGFENFQIFVLVAGMPISQKLQDFSFCLVFNAPKRFPGILQLLNLLFLDSSSVVISRYILFYMIKHFKQVILVQTLEKMQFFAILDSPLLDSLEKG